MEQFDGRRAGSPPPAAVFIILDCHRHPPALVVADVVILVTELEVDLHALDRAVERVALDRQVRTDRRAELVADQRRRVGGENRGMGVLDPPLADLLPSR